ncbi:MAG: hypothetical protein ACLGHN_11390 [Bacteriovoracia bacterium]
MRKQILFLIALLMFASSCGQKSTIKNSVMAEKLQDTHRLTFPLEDTALAYKTPLPGLAPIVGGILKLVGDIFTKTTSMGEIEMTYTQPIPELPPLLQSVRLKRFFFYLKPKKVGKREFKERLRELFDRYILDKGDPTFRFLSKLAIKMSVEHIDNSEAYTPALTTGLPKEQKNDLLKVFDEKYRSNLVDTEVARELVLLKYDKKRRSRDTADSQYGLIHYLEIDKEKILEVVKEKNESASPKEVERLANLKLKAVLSDLKEFFLQSPGFEGNFERVLIFENSLLVEVKKDPIANEIFMDIMNENAESIEKDYFVNFIDTCTELSCLELKVPNVNLIPIASKGNAIKLDAILHAGNVPDSFKLKGFVEFEVKINP